MIQIVFYYKYTALLAEKLYRLNGCNKIQRLLIIEPIVYRNDDFCLLKPSKYIFVPNTVYIAIEYLNYHIDPFFSDTTTFIEVYCIRKTYLERQFQYIIASDLFVDIVLPFMPTTDILKKLKVFAISTEMAAEGLYKLTFVRKSYNKDMVHLFRNLQKDVETCIPNMPILVIGVYDTSWFHRFEK